MIPLIQVGTKVNLEGDLEILGNIELSGHSLTAPLQSWCQNC